MRKIWVDGTFILPAFLVFTVFLVIPVLSSFYYSLTDWNGLDPATQFIGISNYTKLLSDPDVWNAIKITFLVALCLTVGKNALGLTLALGLQGTGKVSRILRVWYLIPVMLSALAIGYIWAYMYSPSDGIVNTLLRTIGLGGAAQDWLGNSDLAIYSIIFVSIWHFVGFTMIIYVAGLQSVPSEVYEAAYLDGAGRWSMFRNVTFPLIAQSFTVNIVVNMIVGIKIFDTIFVMTNGGPGTSTENLSILLYRQAFSFDRMGYASAIAVIMFIIILVLSLLQIFVLRKREVEY
ncbi:carbohydrate ABC transporter permease [Cohnella boryungensis]|uniref:Carbohydrate ABC transporter permease n=1 Tax=Cohnella boryungensis TaxID=768479 RepID=A0ABV8S8L6_9BACL